GHAPVHPGSDVLAWQRGGVVVVARISGYDVGVGLPRQRTDHIRKRIIRQPARAIVVRLARVHPVTGNGRVTLGAACAVARVVPSGHDSTAGADRNVRLPLRTGSSISVQLKWRGESHPTVS